MISPREPVIGLPTFRLSSQDSSSLFFLIRSASFARLRPRFPAAQPAQPLRSSNAFWAAATARSTSSRPPSGDVAIVLPVAGLTTSKVWPSAASTDSPPMTIRVVVGVSVAAASGARCSVVIGSYLVGVCSGGGWPRFVRPWYAGHLRGSVDRGRASARGALDERLRRRHRCPNDPGVVPEGRRDDARPDCQPRDEPVGALAHAA